jgi:ABC-2 type transport system permease protein
VARHFALLKLRLLRNGLRTPQFAVLFAIGTAGAAALAVLGFSALVILRGDRSAPEATLVVFTAVTIVWTVVPLLGFGSDETLDPQRLALLPLRRSQLLWGLFAAALVGVAPVATAFALSGAILGLARDLPTALLIVGATAGTLVLCVVGSRTLIALLAPLLRSRRGRDLMVMILVLGAFVPQAFQLLTVRSDDGDLRGAVHEIAGRVRWTPFSLGGVAAAEAGEGHIAAAAAALAMLFALVAALLWVWSRLIPRAMTASDLTTKEVGSARGRGTSLFPRWAPVLPHTHTGAVAAKELRYFVRDPRRRAPLFAALVIPGLFLSSTLRDAASQPASATLLALVALLPASGLTLNQFGLDGAAFWPAVVAGNDARAELVGKNIAVAFVVVPLIAVPAVLTAAVTDGWAYVPLTIGLAPGMLGVVLAVGNMVSVWAPYALPDRRNPLAGNPGQGCVGGIAAMGALFIELVLALPVTLLVMVALEALPLSVATPLSVVVAGTYGAAAWWIALHAASGHLAGRMPEMLDAVSPRHAG